MGRGRYRGKLSLVLLVALACAFLHSHPCAPGELGSACHNSSPAVLVHSHAWPMGLAPQRDQNAQAGCGGHPARGHNGRPAGREGHQTRGAISLTKAAEAASSRGGCSVCANQSPQLGHF